MVTSLSHTEFASKDLLVEAMLLHRGEAGLRLDGETLHEFTAKKSNLTVSHLGFELPVGDMARANALTAEPDELMLVEGTS
mmetsp:Transcript_38046/g.79983  ORF Transcript_38046/g.79983 Transcript_38046/m.79983 type:complete len:81 (+) Transcript_38046:777-1019(+)